MKCSKKTKTVVQRTQQCTYIILLHTGGRKYFWLASIHSVIFVIMGSVGEAIVNYVPKH